MKTALLLALTALPMYGMSLEIYSKNVSKQQLNIDSKLKEFSLGISPSGIQPLRILAAQKLISLTKKHLIALPEELNALLYEEKNRYKSISAYVGTIRANPQSYAPNTNNITMLAQIYWAQSNKFYILPSLITILMQTYNYRDSRDKQNFDTCNAIAHHTIKQHGHSSNEPAKLLTLTAKAPHLYKNSFEEVKKAVSLKPYFKRIKLLRTAGRRADQLNNQELFLNLLDYNKNLYENSGHLKNPYKTS